MSNERSIQKEHQMAPGHSLPQVNLSAQCGTQGGSHKCSYTNDICNWIPEKLHIACMRHYLKT
ncbi:UNVERIFIED_CONTAM: hypothetical protein NCL1_14127 [Trichonephila clavipes]